MNHQGQTQQQKHVHIRQVHRGDPTVFQTSSEKESRTTAVVAVYVFFLDFRNTSSRQEVKGSRRGSLAIRRLISHSFINSSPSSVSQSLSSGEHDVKHYIKPDSALSPNVWKALLNLSCCCYMTYKTNTARFNGFFFTAVTLLHLTEELSNSNMWGPDCSGTAEAWVHQTASHLGLQQEKQEEEEEEKETPSRVNDV